MRKLLIAIFPLSLIVLFFLQSSKPAPLALGSHLHGFVVTRSVTVTESNATLVELEHEKTGAKVLAIQTDDPENFFSISFRTKPEISNGVAHVLEHSVLQGSKNYPVHNLFYSVRKRSFATYLNAFTTLGITSYPAATQSEADFYNLLAVYTDAVFHPLLTPHTFKQEGHRLEFQDPYNPKSPLVYKGIVYNEMKGSHSSALQRLLKGTLAELMPTTLGLVDVGGDPKVIPELTYDELVAFHKEHYYPGNCLFFFYGNLPLAKHLEFINQQIGHGFDKKPPVVSLGKEKRISERKQVNKRYPATQGEIENEHNTYLALSWLTAETDDPEELFGLKVLMHLLNSSDAAPLKEKLVLSGLCKGASHEFMDEYPDAPYFLYMHGCKKEDAEKIVTLVDETLKELAETGFSNELIARALHGFEIAHSELKRGTKPVGYARFQECAMQLLFGRDPEIGLKGYSLLERVREKIESDPSYLTRLLVKHFVNNPHQVCLVLEPSRELALQEEENVRHTLTQKKMALTSEEIDLLVSDAKKARQEPDAEDADRLLPKVKLSDASQEVQKYDLVKAKIGTLDLFHFPAFTNHMTYATLIYEMPKISEEDLWLVPLYIELMTKLGIKDRPYVDTLKRIEEHTGGVQAALSFAFPDRASFRPLVCLSAKALDRKSDELFTLLNDIATGLSFTEKARIKQLVEKLAATLQLNIKERALEYAKLTALSCQSDSNCLLNYWRGLDSIDEMQKLVRNFDARFDELQERLKRLHESLVAKNLPTVLLACDQVALDRYKAGDLGGLVLKTFEKYEPWKQEPWKYDYQYTINNKTFFEISSTVAFNAWGAVTLPYAHPESSYLRLAALIATNKVLNREIRLHGGAYSAGAEYEPNSGNFLFYSYRDPHIESTKRSFKAAMDLLAEGRFSEQDLEEAKINLIQRIDVPVSIPAQAFVGYLCYLEGNSAAIRKAQRAKILQATKSDIQNAVTKHLVPKFENSKLVTFSSKELMEQEM